MLMQHLKSVAMAVVLALMCTGLVAAQAGLTHASQECREKGGTLQNKPGGESVCFAEIPQGDCFRQCGQWESSETKASGRCLFHMTAQKKIDTCRSNDGEWGRHGTWIYHCFYPKQKQECLEKGGHWLAMNMFGIAGCVLNASDAGKTCRDGSECEYQRCLHTGNVPPPEEPATGTCAPTNSALGCFRLVRNGKVDPSSICAD